MRRVSGHQPLRLVGSDAGPLRFPHDVFVYDRDPSSHDDHVPGHASVIAHFQNLPTRVQNDADCAETWGLNCLGYSRVDSGDPAGCAGPVGGTYFHSDFVVDSSSDRAVAS